MRASRRNGLLWLGAVLSVLLVGDLSGQEPHLAPNAPADRPAATDSIQTAALEAAIAPYIAEARASWPAVKRRYQAGLPPQQSLFVTTLLRDAAGRQEQVFVAVDSVAGVWIHGRIWSDVQLVDGYRYREPYAFTEAELRDWMISEPDGSEEGNVVGKFLDGYFARQPQ